MTRTKRKWPYSLTYKDVTELLELLKQVEVYDQVDLTLGDIRIGLRRNCTPANTTRQDIESPNSTDVRVGTTAEKLPSSSKSVPSMGLGKEALASGQSKIVAAPILGTFYRSPEPSAPPYVQKGDVIKKGDIIGLIEVMKLFTPVPSDISGLVEEFLAENGSLVEYGQPLLRVAPN